MVGDCAQTSSDSVSGTIPGAVLQWLPGRGRGGDGLVEASVVNGA